MAQKSNDRFLRLGVIFEYLRYKKIKSLCLKHDPNRIIFPHALSKTLPDNPNLVVKSNKNPVKKYY